MAQLRKLILLGHPVLRQIAARVAVPEAAVTTLADDLLATMVDSAGVGIAAPQVAESLRVIVVASRPNARYPQAPLMEPLVLVNPEITWLSDDQESGWEGCLSVPGLRGLVPRARAAEVRFLTLAGEVRDLRLEGFPARILQHEHDHLEGLFFTDRVASARDLFSEGEFVRQFA